MADNPQWDRRAKCNDPSVDPAMFFPVKKVDYDPEVDGDNVYFSPAPAKKLCRGSEGDPACSVREECLMYALARNIRHGIWGGMTDGERRKIKRRYKDRGIL